MGVLTFGEDKKVYGYVIKVTFEVKILYDWFLKELKRCLSLEIL